MATIAKSAHTFFPCAFAITISIVSLNLFSVSEANHTLEFSVDLIHRDSTLSPFYNISLTHFERVSNAIKRSHKRANYITLASKSQKATSSEVIRDTGGAYLMKIALGTPPYNILAIADTGSDLIWTQCAPCDECYRQKASLFYPQRSSTYKEISCCTSQCQTLPGCSCDSDGTCNYSVMYGDRSHSRGTLATDTLALSAIASLSETTFGCVFDNGGTFDVDCSGIVGLGGGSISLISQLKPSIGGKFSYCLVPMYSENLKKSSQMYFGYNAIVSGYGVVSTPIIPKSPDTFYFLNLEGFTIGRVTLQFYDSSSASPNDFSSYGNGNIIIDSGTTLTYLPSDVYSRLESAVSNEIGLEPVQGPLNLCYMIGHGITLPYITVHFTGADMRLDL